MSTAVVTIAIGDKYLKRYNRLFRPSHERFARSIGAPLIVITEPLSDKDRHPSWHKCLIFTHPEVARHNRVIYVDADIYIMRGAKNPLSLIPENGYAACRNNPYRDPDLQKVEEDICVQMDPNIPQDKRFILNGGFFIVGKDVHQEMGKMFNNEPDQNNWEQNPLSRLLLSTERTAVLPSYFNAIAITWRRKFGKGLVSTIRLARDNGFIHLCGGLSRGNIFTLAIVRFVDAFKAYK